MNKFKMLALTAMAAAMVGTGALAAAPSASASKADDVRTCRMMFHQAFVAGEVWRLLVATGYSGTQTEQDAYDKFFSLGQASAHFPLACY